MTADNPEYAFTIKGELFGKYKTIKINVSKTGTVDDCTEELKLLAEEFKQTYQEMQDYEKHFESKIR